MLQRLRAALALLTIIPAVADDKQVSGEELRESAGYFPLVGLALGSLAAMAGLLLTEWMGIGSEIAALSLVFGLAVATRGLHLDGVADVIDSLGGATIERRLAIMKDSAIGVFGSLGLIFTVLGKIAGIAALLRAGGAGVLPLAAVPAAARFAILLLAWRSHYPRDQGTGHFLVGRIDTGQLTQAALILLPLALFGLPTMLAMVAATVPALVLRNKAPLFFGGVTGDVLGAACEWGEILGLAAAALTIAARS